MNILFLSKDYPPNLIGGVGIYTLEMSRILAKSGQNVFVITSANDLESEYIDKGVRVCRVKPKRFKALDLLRNKIGGFIERLEYSLSVSKKIKDLDRRFKIDIVESCEARAEGFWYFLFNRKPALVVKLHTPESIVFKLDSVRRNLDYALIEFLENWWIERADSIVGLTDAIVDLTKAYFKLNRKYFPKMPNPIDANLFKISPVKAPSGKRIILYAGRLEFRKGVHILIKTVPIVLKEFPDALFIFAGSDCGMRPYITKKIQEFCCAENVTLKDYISREDLVGYYQEASICVIPSLWENHPYVCLEAMACGRAVIASRVAGLAEIIKDNENGILAVPGSFMDLAEKIKNILKDSEKRGRIGINAKKFIDAFYSPESVLRQAMSIYGEAAKKR
jgi:glycosyltransferase involved in cell wall biosynthesis